MSEISDCRLAGQSKALLGKALRKRVGEVMGRSPLKGSRRGNCGASPWRAAPKIGLYGVEDSGKAKKGEKRDSARR